MTRLEPKTGPPALALARNLNTRIQGWTVSVSVHCWVERRLVDWAQISMTTGRLTGLAQTAS